MAQAGFFDVDERVAALSAAGDPLERLSAVVDFERFRPVLVGALARSDRAAAAGHIMIVLMFKVLMLQWPTERRTFLPMALRVTHPSLRLP